MAQTYGDCWRTVRLYASAAPVFLCREWVNVAWKSLAGRRSWSFLRGELTLRIAASRSVVVTVTQDSTTVTSAALFLAADAGRQFRIGYGPTYTIQTVVDPNTITLDRVYSEPNAIGSTTTIQDVYAVMPTDFGSFRVIPDQYNRRQLAFWITEDQLLILDPDRSTSDSGPRCLVSASFSTYTPTLGQVRYEYWPRPTSVRSYQALYNKQAVALDDTSVFSGVLADGADVLVNGALAQAAGWPGTTDLRNPYFNLQLAQAKQTEFEHGIQRLALKDDAHYMDDLGTVDWARWPLSDLAFDDHALRSTDATVGAFY